MAIDYDGIIDKFVLIARDAVGNDLSQTGPTGGQFPSVIRARQGGIKPDYPYVVVDVLDTMKENSWLLEESVDDNDNPVYETNYVLLLNYIIYGGNALAIANKLEGYFMLPHVRDDIRIVTSGSVVDTTSIDSIPIQISADRFLESSSFQVTFNITDTLVDNISGDTIIEDVSLDGELNRHNNEDNYINLDVDIITTP